MTTEMLWSAALSAVMALIGWILKGHADEVKRLQILLNRTRVIQRIDNLDAKIDRLLQGLAK